MLQLTRLICLLMGYLSRICYRASRRVGGRIKTGHYFAAAKSALSISWSTVAYISVQCRPESTKSARQSDVLGLQILVRID